MWRRILSPEKKNLGGLNPRGIIVREENFGGKPTGRKKFGGKMGPSGLNPRGIIVREENFGGKPTGRKKFGGKMGPSPLILF